MRTLRAAARAALVAAILPLLGSPMAASARGDTVPAKRWAVRVCVSFNDAARRAVSDARAWPTIPSAPASLDDIAERIDTADQALAGLDKIFGGMRAGMRSAGTPAVADGAEVVARTDRTIAKAQKRFESVRRAIARFKRRFDSDPAGAMEELSSIFAGGLDFNLPNVNWPMRLSRAFDRARDCEDARASIDEFVTLVHRKVGGE
jgi:hypothetical protein